jgi:hypothetical protein
MGGRTMKSITLSGSNKSVNYYSPIFGLVALLLLIAPLVSAAGLTEVGVLANGPSYDLVESNGYLYVAQGSEVRVYDVSSSSKMSALTWKDSLGGIFTGSAVYGLQVDSGYLYVASATRLTIADLRDPRAPVIISTLDNPYSKNEIQDVVIRGNIAYLTIEGAGVLVADISDKTAPRTITTVKLSGSNKPQRAAMEGTYLYIGMKADNRLDILDISNPVNPTIAGSYSPGTPGYNSTSSVAVKGHYAYIVQYHYGVRVLDVSNPANPVEVSQLMGIDASDIKILGNYAYVSVRYQGMDIIDISDPTHIQLVGKSGLEYHYYNEGIYPTEKFTFVSLEDMGVGIYDTSSVTSPVALNRINVLSGADSMAVQDNYLYIGGHNDGVWVIDISNPALPKEAAFLSDRNGRNQDIQLQDNYLYIPGQWSRLCVADVSDPTNPRLVVDHFGKNIGYLLPDGRYVYTSLGIVDMTNMAKPVYTATSPYFNGDIAKYGDNYIIVSASGGDYKGLHVIDVSDKKNPVYITTIDPGVAYKDIYVSGNTAVTLTGSSVVTLDLSTISAPVEIDRISFPGKWSGTSITVNDTIVYAVGSGTGQVKAFDVSDPTNITLLQSVEESYKSSKIDSVVQSNGYVFTGGKMGIHVFSTSLVPEQQKNRAPTLSLIGNKTISTNSLLEFTVSATDADNDKITYLTGVLPENATFQPDTKTFSWVPDKTQIGNHGVRFSVTDGKLSDNETINIEVTGVQNTPVLNPIGNRMIQENATLAFNVTATDPDNDELTYSVNGLPAEAEFSNSTGAFLWTPGFDQAGEYTLVFTVTDGVYTVSEQIVIQVDDVNQPPKLVVPDYTIGDEGSQIAFNISAMDPDGDAVTYSCDNLPRGASLDSTDGEFVGTPDYDQAGDYSLMFIASDGKSSASKVAEITVRNVNRPPVVERLTDIAVDEGDPIAFSVNGTDPDNDILIISAQNLPDGAIFDSVNRSFTWTPAENQAGIYYITIEISDGILKTESILTITVNDGIRQQPESSSFEYTVNEGEILEFSMAMPDSNGAGTGYSSDYLPTGSSFSTTTGTFTWVPGYQDAGIYTLVFASVQGSQITDIFVNVTVNNVNRPPVLFYTGNTIVGANDHVGIVVNGTDPDADILNYSVNNLPDGAVFTSANGSFSWIPSSNQMGTYPVTFYVSDGSLSTEETVVIAVMEDGWINQPPSLDYIENKTVQQGQNLKFSISATDPDNTPIVYSAARIPMYATFDPETRIFNWTPGYSQNGTYTVFFRAYDGAKWDIERVAITVEKTNRLPVFRQTGDLTGTEGGIIRFTIFASDPDRDPVQYSAGALPTGAMFNSSTRTFSWTPDYNQAGSYHILFHVTDGSGRTDMVVGITVDDSNSAPVWQPAGLQEVSVGENLQFTVLATDRNGDALIYSVTDDSLPAGATFNAATHTFMWTPISDPTSDSVGTYYVRFSVSDGKVSVEKTIQITVKKPVYILLQ